ncbi:MAG: hypothetical protein FJW69_06860 [Actinobacteria bacterium]|nr:hypothetical protein [Actinomycetota bacterium]
MINKNKKVNTVWKKVEARWPVYAYREQINFNAIKDKVEDFLNKKEVFPETFSHFGFVVKSIEKSMEILEILEKKSLGKLKKGWVEAYKVYVGRIMLDDKEIEFIEPAGESFFYKFLKEEGEGLHHLAFQVNNVKSCFKKLKKKGVETIDKEPRCGSHGKVAFFRPGLFDSMCIELFQKYK